MATRYNPTATILVSDQRGDQWHGVPGFGNKVQSEAPTERHDIVLVVGEKPPAHPEYNDRVNAYKFYQASYDGGSKYKSANDADGQPVFQKHDVESDAAAKKRKARSTYRNYCRPIVDKFFAFVFGSGVERPVDESFESWAEDVDGKGTCYSRFMENAIRQAFILGRWFVIADTSKMDEYETQAQARANGNRLILADLHPARCIDWNADETELLVRHDVPGGDGEVWLWRHDDVVQCKLNDKGEIASMSTVVHGWDGMPIVKLDGLNGASSLIKDISELNKRLFHDDSLLCEEGERQLFTQYFLMGMSGDDIRDQDSVSIGSRKYICISKMDVKLERAAGEPAMSTELRENIRQDVVDIYREAGLRMPDLESGPESGRALRIRQSETIAIAERLADNAEHGENAVLGLFVQAMGTELEPIEFSKNFDEEDINAQLKECLDITTSQSFGPQMKGEIAAAYIGKRFPELDADVRERLVQEARELFEQQARDMEQAKLSGQVGPDGKPMQKGLADQFGQVEKGTNGIREAFGDGQPNPDDEPDEEPKEQGKDVGSGGTSSGRGKPGELREAPGDVRFDTQKTSVDPRARVAQHKLDEDRVDELHQSMKQDGWQGDGILVVIMKNGQHAVLDGHHRSEAAIRAELKDVPAYALTQDQLLALLLLKFGGGLPRKMRKMDPFVFADGKPYTEKRLNNSNKVNGSNASSVQSV